MNKFLPIAILLIISLICQAQTITLTSPPAPVCTGATVPVSFSTTGSFQTGNTFTLQIRSDYGSQLTDIRLTETNGQFTVRIPESTVAADDRRYAFRLVSSAPVIASDWTTSVQIARPASVSLVSALPAQANPYQLLTLRFLNSGTGPMSITLSDSSRIELPSAYYQYNEQTRYLNATKSTTYTIASVRNACGLGAWSGQAPVFINAIALRTVSVSPAIVCQGSTIYVSYSMQGTVVETNNQFKIRLTNYDPNQPLPFSSFSARNYELPAELDNGRLKATLPDSIPASTYLSYYVQVISSQPQAFSDPANVMVRVYPKAQVELTSSSTTVDAGQFSYLNFKAAGLGPHTLSLSDGSTHYYNNAFETGSLPIIPFTTTTYQLTNFQSGCDPSSITPSNILITVRPGIRIDSLPSQLTHCEGATVQMRVSPNFTPTAATQFWADILNNGTDQVVVSAPATLAGNLLSFQLPTLARTADMGNAFSVRVRTANPVTTGRPPINQHLIINAKPSVVISPYTSQSLEKPATISAYMTQPGGGPFEVKLTNGLLIRNDCKTCMGFYAELYARQTATYGIEYVKNDCGTVRNPPGTFTITVKNPEPRTIEIDSVQQNVCDTDSALVYFRTFGDFEADNEFRVHANDAGLCNGCGAFVPIVGRGVKSPIRIKLRTSSQVRIASTKPIIYSNEKAVKVATLPYAELNSLSRYLDPLNGSEPSAVTANQAITISTAWTGRDYGPYSVTFTDGTRDYPMAGNTLVIVPPQDRTTTYRLKAVANQCGRGQVSTRGLSVTPMPYRILVPQGGSYGQTFQLCGTSSISIPFLTDRTPQTPATTYVLQLASATDSVFRDLSTGSRSPLVATIPSTLPEGDYFLRIIDRNSTARTMLLPARLSQPPTATLKLASTATGEIESGRPLLVALNLTGASPWQVQFSNNQQTTVYQALSTYELYPQKGGSFSIRTLVNSCGYGSATGTVTARVKPQLSLSTDLSELVCVGASLSAVVKVTGDFTTSDQMQFRLVTSDGYLAQTLATTGTASGTYSLPIPATVRPGAYTLELISTNSAVSSVKTYIRVGTPPDFTLMGNTVVNPGQMTYLTLRNNSATSTNILTAYALSDGTTGTVSASDIISVAVWPRQTTSYTLTRLSNSCGVGKVAGRATITVNPASSRSINTGSVSGNRYCAGGTLTVPFTATGVFSATNFFTVYLSDTTGNTFKPLSTTGTSSPLKAELPSDTPLGSLYRVRVMSSDTDVSSGASPTTFRIVNGATAFFDSAFYLLRPATPVTISIRFTGEGPWLYTLSNGLTSVTNYANNTPATLTVNPTSPGTYRLISVSNGCGTGRIMDPSATRIDFITATESLTDLVKIGPNPTQSSVRIERLSSGQPMRIRLTNLTGVVLEEMTTRQPVTTLELGKQPAGIFLLTLQVDARTATYRITKY